MAPSYSYATWKIFIGYIHVAYYDSALLGALWRRCFKHMAEKNSGVFYNVDVAGFWNVIIRDYEK